MKANRLLRALAHRNYRLYFAGQGLSLIGTWMQQTAMSWLVFRLTGRSFDLGLVFFCSQAPALVLAPVAGVVSDRWNRRRLLLVTQSLAMAQAFLLALLALTGTVEVWHVLALSLFLGVVNTFDMTTRQAFLTDMVADREHLGNAIALNSSLVNGARLVGPALAGLMLGWTSAGVCFLLNGVSYLAVLAALLAMRWPGRPHVAHAGRRRASFREGIAYTFGFAPIRAILLLLGLVSLAGFSYVVLLPTLAVNTLHGDARTLGLLGTAAGAGALAGALFLAARESVLGLGRWVAGCPALLGLSLAALAAVSNLGLALAVLVVTGFAGMVQMAASNTLLQTIVDEDKRGRVMSFYTLAFLGVAPLGSLLTGYLADRLGPSTTLVLNGAILLAGSAAFAVHLPRLRGLVRPLYIRLQILPDGEPPLVPDAPGRDGDTKPVPLEDEQAPQQRA